MSRYADVTQKTTAQALEALKPAESLGLAIASAVQRLTSPVRKLPLVSALPTASELIDANTAVAEQLLDAQKDFGRRLGQASTPVVAVPGQAKAARTPTGAKA